MSKPLGSACCDNTVTGGYDPIRKDDVFTCDECGNECEVLNG